MRDRWDHLGLRASEDLEETQAPPALSDQRGPRDSLDPRAKRCPKVPRGLQVIPALQGLPVHAFF